MQTSTTIRTLEKAGLTVRKCERPYGSGEYRTEHNGKELTWYDQEGYVVNLHTKRISEATDSQTDYFPGSYWDSLRQAMRSLGLS